MPWCAQVCPEPEIISWARDSFRFGRATLRDCLVLAGRSGTAHKTLLQQRESCQLQPLTLLHPPLHPSRCSHCFCTSLQSWALSRRICASGHFFNVAPHPCADPFPPRVSSAPRLPLPSSQPPHTTTPSALSHPRSALVHCLSASSLAESISSTHWYAVRPPSCLFHHFSPGFGSCRIPILFGINGALPHPALRLFC